jgi:hypothetical protein
MYFIATKPDPLVPYPFPNGFLTGIVCISEQFNETFELSIHL